MNGKTQMLIDDCIKVQDGTWYYHNEVGYWRVWWFENNDKNKNTYRIYTDKTVDMYKLCELHIWKNDKPDSLGTRYWNCLDFSVGSTADRAKSIFHKIDGRIHPLTLEQLEPVRVIKRIQNGENHPEYIAITEYEDEAAK